MKEIFCQLPRVLVLFLTFILPLKFGSTIGVPEMPMTYWQDPVAILVGAWPVLLFPWCAALALFSTLLLEFRKPYPAVNGGALFCGGLFFLLFLSSLTGWRSSSVWDFPAQNTAYLAGMTCYVFALIRICSADRNFIRLLLWTLLGGLVCSVYSAFNQYASGFEDTIRYIQEKEKSSGIKLMDGQFGSRLQEARVSGDFAICNVYGGYLLLLFPLLLDVLYRIGGKVSDHKIAARVILCLPVLGVELFLLKETGSRGAILAAAGGLFFALLCLPMKKRYFYGLLALIPLALGGLLGIVRLGRSLNSMKIRFDYFRAALEMMKNNLLTGSGWGEFMNDYLLLKDVVNDESPHSPHNLILTFGSQCGIGAFLISLLLLGSLAAAGGFLLYRKSRKKTEDSSGTGKETGIGAFGICWGVSGWVLHSMIELNYETPGSFGIAAAVGIMTLSLPEIRTLSLWNTLFPEKVLQNKLFRTGTVLMCMALSVFTLFYSGEVIRAEWNFDRLHSRINLRFADSSQPLPEMDEVRKLLEKCDKCSPFPFAEVSAYCTARGPYYWREALFYLDKAIERSPERSAYYMRKYRIYSALSGKNSPEAQQALQKARTLSPKNPNYYPDGVTPYGRRSY